MADAEDSVSMLARVGIECDQLSPRSSGECPSLTDSFTSIHNSGIYTDANTRRSSIVSATSNSPGWYSAKSASTTSPTTPMTSVHSFCIDSQQIKMEQNSGREQTYQDHQDGLPDLDFWMSPHESTDLSHLTNMSAMNLMDVLGTSDQSVYCPSYPQYPQTMGMGNPSLSRSMFDVHDAVSDAITMGDEDSRLMWPALTSSPPQTIAPSAAFQPMLASSPLPKHEPSTPICMGTHSSAMFSSSPMGLMSPPILPSQHEFEEAKYELTEHDIDEFEFSRHRPSVDRLHRRGYERRRLTGASSRPKPVSSSRSGMHCEVVIAQNEFPCGYPGCTKRFKRQEHKKRHEKTVHEKHKHMVHHCWVPGCNTPFSRTDNLKSHLKNTHGKNSANQRNRYVATLDRHSEYYDPDWVGELTEKGFPVDSKV